MDAWTSWFILGKDKTVQERLNTQRGAERSLCVIMCAVFFFAVLSFKHSICYVLLFKKSV